MADSTCRFVSRSLASTLSGGNRRTERARKPVPHRNTRNSERDRNSQPMPGQAIRIYPARKNAR